MEKCSDEWVGGCLGLAWLGFWVVRSLGGHPKWDVRFTFKEKCVRGTKIRSCNCEHGVMETHISRGNDSCNDDDCEAVVE